MAHEHSLAGREPVGLDDAGHARNGHRLGDRNAGGAHDVLGEALRTLDLRRGRARAEDRDTTTAQLIGDARDEGRLGADHDEAGADRPRQLEQAVSVLRANRMTLAELRNAWIARRSVNLVDRRALRELPGQRMLPPAGADDEDSH